MGFNSQPPEGGWLKRPKQHWLPISFNSQPPEGGWCIALVAFFTLKRFNSQPPEGGWIKQIADTVCRDVSTHSRPKAAGGHLV